MKNTRTKGYARVSAGRTVRLEALTPEEVSEHVLFKYTATFLLRGKMTKERISKLVEFMKERDQKAEEVISTVRSFTSMLYDELESVIQAAIAEGAAHLGNIKRKALSKGLQSFSFELEEMRVVISPVPTAALPNPDFVVAARRLEQIPHGRVVIFQQYADEKFEALTIGEIYIAPDGEWCTTGIVGPGIESSFDKTNLEPFAISLVEALVHRVKVTHMSIDDTHLDAANQSFKNPVKVGF